MGKGNIGVLILYGAAQDPPLTPSEAGLGGYRVENHPRRPSACGNQGQAACSLLHTSYMITPCTGKVALLSDVGGLAVQGTKAGRHNGCILEGF